MVVIESVCNVGRKAAIADVGTVQVIVEVYVPVRESIAGIVGQIIAIGVKKLLALWGQQISQVAGMYPRSCRIELVLQFAASYDYWKCGFFSGMV